MREITNSALQWKYSQTMLNFRIRFVYRIYEFRNTLSIFRDYDKPH
jgi:hypothetical protein